MQSQRTGGNEGNAEVSSDSVSSTIEQQRTRKSYRSEFKLRVVAYAEQQGIRQAVDNYDVNEKSVRQWRQKKTVLERMPKTRRSMRGRGPKWPKLESQLVDWIIKKRGSGNRISTTRMVRQACEFARELGVGAFKGTLKWGFKFMKRNSLSVRTPSTIGQILPEDWEAKAENFRLYVEEASRDAARGQIGNMYEVPLSYDMPSSRSVNVRGASKL